MTDSGVLAPTTISSSTTSTETSTVKASVTTSKKRSNVCTKPKAWYEYNRVENPVDRVTFLQLCHDFLLDPTQLSSGITSNRDCHSGNVDGSTAVVADDNVHEQPTWFDMERCLVPRCMNVQKRVGYLTIPITPVQGTSSSIATVLSSTINRATPYIAPTILGHSSAIYCGFCNNPIILEPSSSSSTALHVYVHPSAPRSYIACCSTCFVDPSN